MTGSVRARAAELDRQDPLAGCRDRFVPAGDGPTAVTAYLDGNSLGRPLRATRERIDRLLTNDWGTRLIRSWDEQWMEAPFALGDRIGTVCLGAAPGQVFVGDSTTVLLYKLLRAAVAAAPAGRTEIVVDTENFPTDRYVAEGVAAETGCTLRWISPEPDRGLTVEEVRAVVGDRTAVVLASHVAYKSAWIADLPSITALAHDAGALVLWDLCHSAGSVPVGLDVHGVDLAVGCSYKYLNGGPGAPAFGYVARRLQGSLRQPIQGWMGHADPFAMGPGYQPAAGLRGFLSGTPPILAMAGIEDTVDLIDEVGLSAVRDKAIALGEFAIECADGLLGGLGVEVRSPREADRRGGHVTLSHPRARALCAALWKGEVIPDYREPDGIRLGLSPLSTSFTEVAEALILLARLLESD